MVKPFAFKLTKEPEQANAFSFSFDLLPRGGWAFPICPAVKRKRKTWRGRSLEGFGFKSLSELWLNAKCFILQLPESINLHSKVYHKFESLNACIRLSLEGVLPGFSATSRINFEWPSSVLPYTDLQKWSGQVTLGAKCTSAGLSCSATQHCVYAFMGGGLFSRVCCQI